jgi:hypothetical protein
MLQDCLNFVELLSLTHVDRTILEHVPDTCDDAQASTIIDKLLAGEIKPPEVTVQIGHVPRRHGDNMSDAKLREQSLEADAALMSGVSAMSYGFNLVNLGNNMEKGDIKMYENVGITRRNRDGPRKFYVIAEVERLKLVALFICGLGTKKNFCKKNEILNMISLSSMQLMQTCTVKSTVKNPKACKNFLDNTKNLDGLGHKFLEVRDELDTLAIC